MIRLIDVNTKKEIKERDPAATFRGEVVVVSRIWPPGTSQGGRGGRVQLEDGSLFFPSVINAAWVHLKKEEEE